MSEEQIWPAEVIKVQAALERMSGVEVNPGKISVMKQAHDMPKRDGQQRGRNRPTMNRYTISFLGESEPLEEIEFMGDPKTGVEPDLTKLRSLLRKPKTVEQAPRLLAGDMDTGATTDTNEKPKVRKKGVKKTGTQVE